MATVQTDRISGTSSNVLVESPGLISTSTTSLTIGTGTKSLTVGVGLQFQSGQFVTIADHASTANYMFGSITSYNSVTGALVVSVTATGGSGTKTAWDVSISGAPGPTGATGATGPQGPAGPAGAGNVTGPGSSTANHVPKFADASGQVLSDGYAVSNPAKSTVASVDGATTANKVPKFGDTAGTIKDGYAVSDNTKSTVAAVSGATTVGHFATFADTAGTIQDGGAAVSGLTLLQTVSAANQATVPLETTIDSTYEAYLITYSNVVAQSASQGFNIKVKVGGAYVGANYEHASVIIDNAGIVTGQGGATATALPIIAATDSSTGGTDGISGQLWLHSPAQTSRYKNITFETSYGGGAGFKTVKGGGRYKSGAGAVTGVEFFFDSGNVVSGEFKLYGVKKS